MSVQHQIDKLIAIRAAEWYDAICSGEAELSSDEFRHWIGESTRHVDAFMIVAGQAPLIREVLQSNTLDLQAVRSQKLSDVLHLELPTAPTLTQGAAMRERRKAKNRLYWPRAAAWAAIAASVTILAVLLWTMSPRSQRLETATAEQRAITLPDGSVVNLNARSIAEVQLRERTRDIRLVQGEAIFKVARDPQRAFRVHTPAAMVRAIGTEFAVSIRDEGTTVTVLEGKVEVAPSSESFNEAASRGDTHALATAVAAGQEARVAKSGSVHFEPHADVATSVAWLKRKLVFRRTPLEDMVSEVNRYNGAVQLHIEDVPPGVYRFNGTFDANDPLSLADLLSREAGLIVERRGSHIYIREVERHRKETGGDAASLP